jgi:arabinan endo-1,5-alpha-L-arabinosidase
MKVPLAALVLAALPHTPILAQSTRPTTSTRPSFTSDPAVVEKLKQLGSTGQRAHDPSTIVRCKDEFWLFATGRGIMSYRSKDLINWTQGPAVIEKRPAWTLQAVPEHRGGEQGHYWAPDVIHHGGRYLLYYSVSTFGRNTSAIGLIANQTLDPADPQYKWQDQGIVIQSSRNDNFNAIDPAVTTDLQGNLWMSFGSFWSGLKLVQLDPKTGKRLAPDSPIHSIARAKEIEAPFIYPHDGHYYLLFNWGICCRGTSSTYNIRVGRSKNITGPYLDKDGKDLNQGGGSLVLETESPFIGPGHPGILKRNAAYHLSMHFYDPTRRGAGTLALRPLTWDKDGWPLVPSPRSPPH